MRFSLRSLLLLIVAIAFLGAVCFAFPVWLANLVMAPLPIILPALFTVGLIYGRKATRAFFVGAVGATVGMFPEILDFHRDAQFIFLETMERLHSAVGQPRTLLDEYRKERLFTEAIYLEQLFWVLCSVVSGFVCQGVWLLCWKDRGNQGS